MITLKDYLLINDEIVKLTFDDFWYYHTPETDLLLNTKTKKRITLYSQDEYLSTQLNINIPFFTIINQKGNEIYTEEIYIPPDFDGEIIEDWKKINWKKFLWDKDNKIIYSINKFSHWTRYEYNELGKLMKIEKENGYCEKFYYNNFNQLILKKDNDGNGFKISYNKNGTILKSERIYDGNLGINNRHDNT